MNSSLPQDGNDQNQDETIDLTQVGGNPFLNTNQQPSIDQAEDSRNTSPDTTDTFSLGISDKTVGDILADEKLINPIQYQQLKVEALNKGINIDKLLLESKAVPEDKFYEARGKMAGVPFISITKMPVIPEALSLVPKSVAKRFNIIPFALDKGTNTLSVAMADPLDVEAVTFLRQKTGLNLVIYQAIPKEISSSIDAEYAAGLVGEVKEALKETEQITPKTFDENTISQVNEGAPIAKIVSTILEYSMKSRASDVHIEPQEDRVRVRYRIDGILYERLSLPKGVQDSVVSRIKILSNLKIDEHRMPQDGRFNFKFGDDEVDLRISVLPIVFGEKVVMRLLRKSGGIPSLPDLGLRGLSLKNLEASILRPHGIIIVCGPTGSGKTTTLYAVLSKLNTTRVNILTLEDPVEYQISGTNQVQINPDVGLTFASGLRSFLRQDPNIILVGEIRDKETTELAIQAALTGHLVFSTLHTSSAASSLPRLIDLGAETFLLASTMNAVIGQRIARKICNKCKINYVPPKEILIEMKKTLGDLGLEVKETTSLFKGKGCDECGHSGYLGRIGIFEVLPVSEKIAKLILQKSDAATIEKAAVQEGMTTMKQDGYLKVIEGITTVDEVLRVAQD